MITNNLLSSNSIAENITTPPISSKSSDVSKLFPDEIEPPKEPQGSLVSVSGWIVLGIVLVFPLWLLIAGIRYGWQEIERAIVGPLPDTIKEAKITLQDKTIPFSKKAATLSEAIQEYWLPLPRSGESFLHMLFPFHWAEEPLERWSNGEKKSVLETISSLIDLLSREERAKLPPTISKDLLDPKKHQAIQAILKSFF